MLGLYRCGRALPLAACRVERAAFASCARATVQGNSSTVARGTSLHAGTLQVAGSGRFLSCCQSQGASSSGFRDASTRSKGSGQDASSSRNPWQAKRSDSKPADEQVFTRVKDVFRKPPNRTSRQSHRGKSSPAATRSQPRLKALFAVARMPFTEGPVYADSILRVRDQVEAGLCCVNSPVILHHLVHACASADSMPPELQHLLAQVLDRVATLPKESLLAHQKHLLWMLHWCNRARVTTPDFDACIADTVSLAEICTLTGLVSAAFSLTTLNAPSRVAQQLVTHPLLAGHRSTPSSARPTSAQLLIALQYGLLSGIDCFDLLQLVDNVDQFVEDLSQDDVHLYRLLPLIGGGLRLGRAHLDALELSAARQRDSHCLQTLELTDAARQHLCDRVGGGDFAAGACSVGGVYVSALLIADQSNKLVPRQKWAESFVRQGNVDVAAVTQAGLCPVALTVCPSEHFLRLPSSQPTGHTILVSMSLAQQGCAFVPVVAESGASPPFRPVPTLSKSYPHKVKPFGSWAASSP